MTWEFKQLPNYNSTCDISEEISRCYSLQVEFQAVLVQLSAAGRLCVACCAMYVCHACLHVYRRCLIAELFHPMLKHYYTDARRELNSTQSAHGHGSY